MYAGHYNSVGMATSGPSPSSNGGVYPPSDPFSNSREIALPSQSQYTSDGALPPSGKYASSSGGGALPAPGRYTGASSPGLLNTLSVQLQQISAVLAMAPNNPLAAGRAAQKITMLATDEETLRHMLDQPGSEVVLLQLSSMVQLIAMPEDTAFEAASYALEAVRCVSSQVEGRRQILAKGSLPGRVMATRPPEEVVSGMLRDLFSALAGLVHSPGSAVLRDAVGVLKNLLAHDLVWPRLAGEPEDCVGTLVAGLCVAMRTNEVVTSSTLTNSWKTGLSGLFGGGALPPPVEASPLSYDIMAESAECMHILSANPEFVSRLLEIPNYLEQILMTLTQILQEGADSGPAGNAAMTLGNLMATGPGQMKVIRRHPKFGVLLLTIAQIFMDAQHIAGGPFIHARNRCISHLARAWASLSLNEAFGTIVGGRRDIRLEEVIRALAEVLHNKDAGIAANAVVATYRIMKMTGPEKMVKDYPEHLVAIVAGLCAGLHSPEAYVAESACAAVSLVVERGEGRTWMFERQPRMDIEKLLQGMAQLLQHTDSGAAGLAADALSAFLTGPTGEAFLNKFLQGGLPRDPRPPNVNPQGLMGFMFGSRQDPGPGDFDSDPTALFTALVNNAYHVLDSLLLGLAAVLRRPADKLAATNAAEVLCCVCAVECAWIRLMGQPFELINALLVGLVALSRCGERAAARNAAVVLHCFTLDKDGLQILQEQDRTQAKTMLLGLQEMQRSGDTTTADLATGALSNLAQLESWRARMQMLDMINTFTMKG
ncbi:hypothetical protein CYMTET_36835 [Cymbomonas tetramitiformis]|uniref:Uncharacterized protein n=1 Tax=Cymbomonas tetramitiformis TaxID=36881 RepID=A0AAE0CHD6_9CHLO|nr:hypothetical protein CYMTET_36835 [Cymbomonas tetramitiformis]